MASYLQRNKLHLDAGLKLFERDWKTSSYLKFDPHSSSVQIIAQCCSLLQIYPKREKKGNYFLQRQIKPCSVISAFYFLSVPQMMNLLHVFEKQMIKPSHWHQTGIYSKHKTHNSHDGLRLYSGNHYAYQFFGKPRC